MAYIDPRQRKDGGFTYYVRWRNGGRRTSPPVYERFDNREAAEEFKGLVNAAGQRWPAGWVPGRGFVTEEDNRPVDVPWLDWCLRYVDRLTGIQEDTRESYRGEVLRHLSLMRHTLFDGRVFPATVGNITADDVQDWVRAEQRGKRARNDPEKWLRRPAAPKSIQNRHGLMWCIVQAAVDAGLRTTNCCAGTKLPRVDSGTQEEMVFLEREEWTRLRAEITNPGGRDLADWLIGTGMRFGEATAVQVRDINLSQGTVSVQRAWKGKGRKRHLGPPKTRKSRRLIPLSPSLQAMARRLMAGQGPEVFLFRTTRGNAWNSGTFYNRVWTPALDRAAAKGLTKRPRVHDARHTLAAWLIAARIPLPAIQALLGHQSIQTTVDRYGHLVRELDDQITAAVEAATAAPMPSSLTVMPVLVAAE
ncbi:MAG TPA: site-specific integrase [Streptomyces sp.]|nr:site-specific integrase [Streptomyces sp.]